MSERHKHEARHSSKRRSRFRTHEARQGGGAGPRACLEELYELRREIGRGATSIVYEARSRLTGDAVAVKTVPKAALDMKFFASEVRIMRCLRHPNIVALLDVVESEDCVHLIMELVTGGELYSKIRQLKTYTERDVACIVRQIMSAVYYMHQNSVCHRDLKPENLLCEGTGDEIHIKIADFGISRMYKVGQDMSTVCGSPEYVAPEMLQPKPYSPAVDNWNVGVVTYTLLCGYIPFFGETWEELFTKIATLQYSFGENWDVVSDAAKDFVRRLLQFAADRPRSQEALEHPWLCGAAPPTPLVAAQAQLRLHESLRTVAEEQELRPGTADAADMAEVFSMDFARQKSEAEVLAACPVDVAAQARAAREAAEAAPTSYIQMRRLSDAFL